MSISIKVSELIELTNITSDDYFVVNDSGSITTKRASFDTMADWMTGSMFTVASASYVLNAISSSYALTSSYAITSSCALTSSYSLLSTTASYVRSSSYALTSSVAISSSYSLSSSYCITGSYYFSGSYALTSSHAISSSYALTSSHAISSSYAFSASYAISSSYAFSASYAISSSYVLTSSRALTSSWADNVVNVPTSGIPIGTIIDFAGVTNPSLQTPNEWLLCDGTQVSSATYPTLWSVLQNTWDATVSPAGSPAGSVGTVVTLPNLCRRTTIGSGGTAITSPANTVGSTNNLSTETHTLIESQLATHYHTISTSGFGSYYFAMWPGGLTNNVLSDPDYDGLHGNGVSWDVIRTNNIGLSAPSFNEYPNMWRSGTAWLNMSALSLVSAGTFPMTMGASGNNAAHNNMPPCAVVSKYIRAKA